MCDNVMWEDPSSLQYVFHWFVTQQQVKLWHDDSKYYYDDELNEWNDGYKKRKAQKVQIKEELLPFAWHPWRWWAWCAPEDKKNEIEKLWVWI